MLINRRQLGATAIGGLLAAQSIPLYAQGAKVSLKVGGQFQAYPSRIDGDGRRLCRYPKAI